MKNILVIDNRDSFVYNIVEYLRDSSRLNISVVSDDGRVRMEDINFMEYDGVVLSPGAGLPEEYSLMMDYLKSEKAEIIPTLGVCLGLQAMVCATGGKLRRLTLPKHGHRSKLHILRRHEMLVGLADETSIARYHSWVADEESLPKCWEIIALDEDTNVMVVSHTDKPWVATQFHPESIITAEGRRMINNWIERCIPQR